MTNETVAVIMLLGTVALMVAFLRDDSNKIEN